MCFFNGCDLLRSGAAGGVWVGDSGGGFALGFGLGEALGQVG
jgi:hypothetical protein